MVSATNQTRRRRYIRRAKMGQKNANRRRREASPPFPIHPEGYDPSAPDAKPAESVSK